MRSRACLGAAAAILLHAASAAAAGQRFALIVTGASGGPEYVAQYDRWSSDLARSLIENLKFDPALVTVLTDTTQPASASSADNVRRVVQSIARGMTREDVLLIVLLGHGTFDGTDAKFNLVGRDLESSEWSELLRPLRGRFVLVNTASASFPFLERLAGPRRIVVTSTDSPAQRFDTVFPEYFIPALSDTAADLDKNGRISVWEAFAAASAGVGRHYRQRGQLSTERALLDDNGDGVGSEPASPGEDGSSASRTYLDESLPGAAPTDEVMLKLLQRKTMLEAEVEDLKIRKRFLPAAEYAKEFERIMIELAQVSQDIRLRARSGP
jgi:hypothetical protein